MHRGGQFAITEIWRPVPGIPGNSPMRETPPWAQFFKTANSLFYGNRHSRARSAHPVSAFLSRLWNQIDSITGLYFLVFVLIPCL
jgi:hypothetical protein